MIEVTLGKEIVREFMNNLDEEALRVLARKLEPYIEINEPTASKILKIGEAGDYCNANRSTFYGWRKKYKELRDIEINIDGSIRYERKDLDEFMKNKKNKRNKKYYLN